jgi:hypothetical protein
MEVEFHVYLERYDEMMVFPEISIGLGPLYDFISESISQDTSD